MSPSKIKSNILFAYDQYLVECNANGKTPVAPTETAKAIITRLLHILIPTNAWLHVELDDFGIEAQITKSTEHPPYALTIRTDYIDDTVYANYYMDAENRNKETIVSKDLLDIVEFCIVALRQNRFNFSASKKNKPTSDGQIMDFVKKEMEGK